LMLADVLAAARVVGPTILVTESGSERARRLAWKLGARVVDDPGGGRAPAVVAALATVEEWPALVVNADLPEVEPRDLLALLGAMPEDGIGLAPASDGTTNALALARPGLFQPLYGPRSAKRFLAHAEKEGIPAIELLVPGLAVGGATSAA